MADKRKQPLTINTMNRQLPSLYLSLALALLLTGGTTGVTAQTLAFVRQQMSPGLPTSTAVPTQIGLSQLLTQLETTYQVRFNYKAALVRDMTVLAPPLADFSKRIPDQLNELLAPALLQCRSIDASTFVIQPRLKANPQPTVRWETSKGILSVSELPSIGSSAKTAEIIRGVQFPAVAQDRSVTGNVTGETGEGLPGVSVLVKGTTRGATTDAKGAYRLEVPDGGATLVFSFVGFLSQEVAVGSRTTVDIQLVPDEKSLSEVVVVGYSTIKKESLTGAVSAIKGPELVKRTTSNVQQALQGQIPGLTVLDQGAGPGRADMVLRIRGTTTLGANEPLVIVDGIEQRLSDINPLDIDPFRY